MSVISCLLVALGGALGSVLRFLLTHVCASLTLRTGFPVGTMGANVCGCLLIGLFASIVQRNPNFSEPLRLLIIPGLLGGFTTYSAFAFESVTLFSESSATNGILYFVLTGVLALAAVAAGATLARFV